MPRPAAVLALIRRAQRYQRWHADPAIRRRTHFFGAAAMVNRALARHALLSRFLIDLGTTLEFVNSQRALEIRAGRLYPQGSVDGNTLDFIQFEQSIVQTHLDDLRRRAPRSYRREVQVINTVLGALRYAVFRAFAQRCIVQAADEALRCLGGELNFAEQHCRVMLGAQIAYHATLRPAPLTDDFESIVRAHVLAATQAIRVSARTLP